MTTAERVTIAEAARLGVKEPTPQDFHRQVQRLNDAPPAPGPPRRWQQVWRRG